MTPEQEQAEEDASLARYEDWHLDEQQAYREDLLARLDRGHAVNLDTRAQLVLAQWITDLRRTVDNQRATIDALRPDNPSPF